MKKLFSILAFLLTLVDTSLSGQSIQEVSIMDNRTNPGQYLEEISLPPAKQKNSVYINEQFLPGKLLLGSGYWVDSVRLRYDLQNDLLEIKTKSGEIKVCDISQLSKYEVVNFDTDLSGYIDKDTYSNIENKLYKVIHSSDKFKLLEYSYLEIKKPNYNPVLDVGSKDFRYVAVTKLFVMQNQKAHEVKRNPNSISKVYNVEMKSIKQYIKENNLDLKYDVCLVQTIEYCINN